MLAKPKRFVNYTNYTLFMSFLAHEKKRLGVEEFITTFKTRKYSGLKQKYLDSYIEYLENQLSNTQISYVNTHKKLIVDPYTYTEYFEFKNKDIINESLKEAIPEFLKRGLLITEVQEAVHAYKSYI